ncbi:MAG TPA: hypothetical protein VGO47_11305 [Chlamydiales bacterium]|nr:hypothetical protein [Chlamydiales bacterium]
MSAMSLLRALKEHVHKKKAESRANCLPVATPQATLRPEDRHGTHRIILKRDEVTMLHIFEVYSD